MVGLGEVGFPSSGLWSVSSLSLSLSLLWCPYKLDDVSSLRRLPVALLTPVHSPTVFTRIHTLLGSRGTHARLPLVTLHRTRVIRTCLRSLLPSSVVSRLSTTSNALPRAPVLREQKPLKSQLSRTWLLIRRSHSEWRTLSRSFCRRRCASA